MRPPEGRKKWRRPNADYVLSIEQRREVLKWMKTLRFLDGYVLTPKNGTGERLTCGLSLVMNTIRPEKISSKESVKVACSRQCAIRSAEGLFALLKGEFSGMHGDVARCKERTS
jgi:hypothetical protein